MSKFDQQFHTGFILEIAGSLVAIASTQVHDGAPLAIGGGVLGFIGFIITASSSTHIRNAGIILRGNSIVVPLNNKKKPSR